MLLLPAPFVTRVLPRKTSATIFSMSSGGMLVIAAVTAVVVGEGRCRRSQEERSAEKNRAENALHHWIPFFHKCPKATGLIDAIRRCDHKGIPRGSFGGFDRFERSSGNLQSVLPAGAPNFASTGALWPR
jgi:hypothetical protein